MKKKINLLLFFGILSAVLLVGGIPMIIIGAGKNTFLLVTGIVFTAFDFYACPIIFSLYGSAVSLNHTVQCVMSEHIYNVKDIAVQTGKNEEIVRNDIRTAIEKRYITGLLFDGEKLFYNNNAKAARTTLRAKCPSCGAPVDYFSDEANPTCPYCGMPIDVKTGK